MGNEREVPSSSSTPYLGAGGKFRKPAARKPPRTPYDRPLATATPPVNQSIEGGGWLSKLVSPARRLIADSANRILPSFFSRPVNSVPELPPSNATADDDDEQYVHHREATPYASDDSKHALKLGVSRSTGEAGPGKLVDKFKLKDNLVNTNHGQDNSSNSCDDSEMAKIECLVKGKRFSRDETQRLMEILKSRVIDEPDAERKNKAPIVVPQEPVKVDLLDTENFTTSTKGKLYSEQSALPETPMPRYQPNMQDEVVASPIDIARAYMGRRTSELGIGSYSMIPKDEKEHQPIDILPSKPFFPTPSPKSSACWPGAMVQDQRGYLTPQSQRVRYGLHNFPRTPYSRTIYSNSKPKLTQIQTDSRSPNSFPTPFQQSQTRLYGQAVLRNDVIDGGYGSVGPIRRIRNKFATEAPSTGSRLLYSAQKQTEKSSISTGFFLPVSRKNSEAGETSGTSDFHAVGRIAQASEGVTASTKTPHETVRKILEQLDRHKPTPKEKAAEMKLATEWKQSAPDLKLVPKESNNLADLTGINLQEKGDFCKRKSSIGERDDRGNYEGRLQETTDTNAMTEISGSLSIDAASAGTSLSYRNTHDSEIRSTNEKSILRDDVKENVSSQNLPWSFHNGSNGQDLSRKRSSQPPLKPILFNRPDPQQVVSSDNGRGFTFPFAASSGLAAEPPTPSIMPSFPANDITHKQTDAPGPSVLTYNFGTESSSTRLIFRFPSTSNASADVESSDLKFNFGSEKKRVSFGPVGKDAVCF